MAIPKIIHQTYATKKLPLITRLFISWMKFVNRDYQYEFYDDRRIEEFLKSNYPDHVYEAYSKIAIGAAKADFFRYALLLKRGGVYIDIDGAIVRSLSHVVQSDDVAVITKENTKYQLYVQWALIYEQNHPFLKRTIEKCIENIRLNRYPHDVHRMTGPSVYTEAINECLAENPSIPYRLVGLDYNRNQKSVLIPKHFLNSAIYFRKERWTKTQKLRTVLK